MSAPDRLYAVVSEDGLSVQVLGDQRRLLAGWSGAAVEIRKRKSQRSLQQNAWIWSAAYPQIAEALGYEPDEIEELHYGLWAKFAGVKWDDRLQMLVPAGRSSRSDTKRFSDYMEWLVRFAVKDCGGLVITLPDEREGAA